MTWTADKPKKTGWYWYRATPSAEPHPVKIFDASVMYLWPCDDRATDKENVAKRLTGCAGEFAGPINPPLPAGNHSERREYTAIKLVFRLAKILPADQPLSVPLLRLMMASNDVRHIQKLMLAKDERIGQSNAFEEAVLNGEILHLERLLCGHLYEAGVAFREIDRPHPEIADAAVCGTEYEPTLQRLREMYASDPPGAFHRSFLYEVRNQFGFHYKPERIKTKLEEFLASGALDAEVIHAEELSGLSRYVIADHISIGIVQDILKAELPDLHEVYGKTLSKALALARDLSDVVDLMLLPLLEKDQSAILNQETGTLSAQVELMDAKQEVDEMRASSMSTEQPESSQAAEEVKERSTS
jgi:hypothetical protein